MRLRTLLRLVALAAAMALLAAACGSDDDASSDTEGDISADSAQEAEEPAAGADDESADEEAAAEATGDPIVIGMISDLTGPTSDVGVAYSEGQRAYIDAVNASGGIEGRPIEVLWQDYQYDVATAEQLYSQYIDEGAVAFMGWGTADTEALRDRIVEDEVPFMSASLTESLIDPSSAPYNFIPASTYSEQLRVALRYIADEGGGSVAVFHNDSPFGTSPLADGEAYIADNGLDIEMRAIPMPGGATDYTGEIIQADNPDYVVIQNVPSPAATLVRDLVSQGSAAQVICLNWCGNEILVELAGADAEGVLAVQPFLGPGSGAAGLDEIVAQAGSEDAVSIGYVHGWSVMKAMVTGIEQVAADGGDVNGPAIKDALEQTTLSTGGLSADISFSTDSHAGMAGSPIQIVTDGTWQPFLDTVTP